MSRGHILAHIDRTLAHVFDLHPELQKDWDHLKELTVGWLDGKGDAITIDALFNVVRLLMFLKYGPAPQLSPTPDSGVDMVWRLPGNILTAALHPAGEVTVVTDDSTIRHFILPQKTAECATFISASLTC